MAAVVTRFNEKPSSSTRNRRARTTEWTELTIQIPPLRDRAANVIFLAELFILMSMPLSRRTRPARLSEQAKLALTNYAWPGNAQELRGVMERALSLATGDVITLEHLPQEISGGIAALCEEPTLTLAQESAPQMSLREEIEALEKRRILEALAKYPTQREAAAALDIPMSTFLTRLDAFGIPRVRAGRKPSGLSSAA